MGGMPPQGGGQGALGQLAKKPSSPDSGAPLLQMIMTFLAGSGLKDVSSSLTSLMKAMGGGADKTHHKQPGAPPGMQPSKPGMPPTGPQGGATPPPGLVAGQGGPPPGGAPPGGAGGQDPAMLMKLLQMLMGGGQGGPPQQ